MNAAIDIGNTFIKIGFFEDKKLLKKNSNIHLINILKLLKNFDVKKLIISDVAKKISHLYIQLGKKYSVLYLTHKTSLPIRNDYLTPETLGIDRLAAVVGAFSLYPYQNNLIIDVGTCITYDFLDKNARYLGGNITPGLKIRLQSLHQFTANLPLVETKNKNIHFWGNSTKTCIQSGAIYGIIYEIEGFIKQYRKSYFPLNIIFCGGDSEFFETKIKIPIFVQSNLILYGLNEILIWNK